MIIKKPIYDKRFRCSVWIEIPDDDIRYLGVFDGEFIEESYFWNWICQVVHHQMESQHIPEFDISSGPISKLEIKR